LNLGGWNIEWKKATRTPIALNQVFISLLLIDCQINDEKGDLGIGIVNTVEK
jgi:hypothetical protein